MFRSHSLQVAVEPHCKVRHSPCRVVFKCTSRRHCPSGPFAFFFRGFFNSMCSPDPAGLRGGRGGGRHRSGYTGVGRKAGGGTGIAGRTGEAESGGLTAFWSYLDPKQRDSLLTINGGWVTEATDCDLCRELLASAIRQIEEGAGVCSSMAGVVLMADSKRVSLYVLFSLSYDSTENRCFGFHFIKIEIGP